MATFEDEFNEEDKEELIDECIGYVEENILDYINDNLLDILIELLDDKYDSNLMDFIEGANKEDVENKYKEILNEDGSGYIIDFCYDKGIDYEEIIDNVFDILNENVEIISEEIYDKLLKVADEHIDDPLVNMYFTSYQLKELDDKVGDRITNYTSRDYNERDKCFIDIDGQIFVSEGGQTHAQLVNSYLESIKKDTRKETFYRPDNEDMEELAKKFGFGEIDEGIFFVEESDSYGNMSAKEIVDDLLKSGVDYEKIYTVDEGILTRVANRLKKKADTENLYFIPDEESVSVMNENDNYYDELIKQGYKRLYDAPYGSWGCFACTIDPNFNIELFILEIYFLKKDNPRKYSREDTPELFLLEYHIDNNGNRIESRRKNILIIFLAK